MFLPEREYIIVGSCHKYHFCCDKRFVVTNTCLSQQILVCHDKTHLLLRHNTAFAVTNMFVATNICHDKTFCRDKHLLS